MDQQINDGKGEKDKLLKNNWHAFIKMTALLQKKNLSFLLKSLFFGGLILICACENDIEKINSLTANSLPEISGKKVEIIYSDSGKVKMQLNANEIRQFAKAERPYIEFPQGIHVIFFDDSVKHESEILADYAKYYQEDRFWEARGNVMAVNLKSGKKLNTEELFWDEKLEKIYSNSFSRIETERGTFYGQKGFESNQKLTHWKLKESKGSLTIKDDSDAPKNP
jgi:LPS export ABC transporter protein LptC